MAGKIDITLPEAEQAVKTFCEIYDSCSFVKPGPDLFEITVTDGEKAVVSLINGSLECQRRPELKDKLLGIIMDAREGSPRMPINGTSLPGKAIMPKPARNGSNGALVKPEGSITARDVIDYINPKATEQEAFLFAEFCRRKGADPMTKQVYLAIFVNDKGERNVSFIAGKEYFTEKAEAHPQFDGLKAGIIVRPKAGGELDYREGTFYLQAEETLLGGWAEIYRKDRKIPSKAEVAMYEYNTGKRNWSKMPATMIRKVAMVQALREAFPQNLGGMYDRAEMVSMDNIDPENEISEAA